MAKLEDYLGNSQLDEAKKGHPDRDVVKAFGRGYFVDPSGKLYDIGAGKTHEEWASERNSTVQELIDKGWTRIRNFHSPSMNYIQGDSDSTNNIWYLVDLAEQVGKRRILFWVGRQRIELIKKNNEWETPDGRKIGEITESKIRTVPVIVA